MKRCAFFYPTAMTETSRKSSCFQREGPVQNSVVQNTAWLEDPQQAPFENPSRAAGMKGGFLKTPA